MYFTTNSLLNLAFIIQATIKITCLINQMQTLLQLNWENDFLFKA